MARRYTARSTPGTTPGTTPGPTCSIEQVSNLARTRLSLQGDCRIASDHVVTVKQLNPMHYRETARALARAGPWSNITTFRVVGVRALMVGEERT